MVRIGFGVFAIDPLKDDFVTCASKVYRKSQMSAKLPFAIANTDPINKGGMHWFSLIKLQDISGAIDNDSFFMFYSFGLVGFTSFIVQDDSELISTFLIDLRSDESYENMINLYSFTFLPNVYLRLTENEIDNLSATCKGLHNFFTAFAISQNLEEIKIHGVHKQLQLKDTATCGVFQLFVLDKTYKEVHKSICKQHSSCTVETIRDILDLYFVTGTKHKRILN